MKDEQFERSLRLAFGEVGRRRGACPDVESLAAYARNSGEQASPVYAQDHVRDCGVCHALVCRIREFDRTIEPEPASRWWALLRGPLPGYALAAGLALLLLRTGAQGPMQGVAPAVVLSLGTRAAGAGSAGVADLSKSTVVLSFFVPVEAEKTYRAAVRRKKSAQPIIALIPITADAEGGMNLVLPPGLLERGDYQLVVEETGGREYAFDFSM